MKKINVIDVIVAFYCLVLGLYYGFPALLLILGGAYLRERGLIINGYLKKDFLNRKDP
jgi:hypothetical protein